MSSRYMNYLRKNGKLVMVIMGVVCMFTFVIGAALTDMASNAQRNADLAERNPVVVTWTNGQVRATELDTLRYRHRIAYEFLFTVIRTALERGGKPIINGRPASLEQQFFEVGIPQDNSEESAMQTLVLAEEGRRMGVVVGQDAVKDFLRQISSPELKDGDWLGIATEIVEREKGGVAVSQIFEHLAYELKAQHVRMLALAGLYAQGVGPIVPPGEAFELFNRINRRYSIEAYPVDVQTKVSEVKAEPSVAEVQKLFDQGKYRDPNPNTDEPGFHKPHRLKFKYLKVNFTPFLDEAKKQITEEQIEEAYKKDIEQGLHKVQELPPATAPPGEKKESEQKEGETPPVEAKPSGEKSEIPPDAANAAEKPVEKSGDKPGEKPGNEKNGCESSNDPPAGKTSDDQPATAPPVADKPADEKPAETTNDPAQPAAVTTPAKEQKFKPLAEVRDQILTRLAQPIAEEARKKATGEVFAAIEKYGKTYRRYLDLKNRKAADVQDPGQLDLVPLAAKYSFPIDETPLVDQFEISNYEIGQKVQQLDMQALQMRQIRMRSFAEIAFSQDEPLFKPEEGRSSVPDVNYIYFRTAEEKLAEVTLKDARPQIVEFWKKRKAYELALADAQQLADKAKGAASLGDVAPDATKIIKTEPFSWMTAGGFGMGQPELSQVSGIELAGREFMQAVFGLKPGESGVAPNQSHGKVYVVRVLTQEPDDERLRSQFLESGYNNLVIMLAQGEALHTSIEWYRGVADQYQVKWQRPPDERRRM